jgi:predicted cation transporter
MVIAGLLIVLLLVLVLPFLSRTVQANLEIFLLIMGLTAAWISKSLNMQLILKSLKEPIMITSAVFIAGLLFLYLQDKIRVGIKRLLKVIPLKMFVFFDGGDLGFNLGSDYCDCIFFSVG